MVPYWPPKAPIASQWALTGFIGLAIASGCSVPPPSRTAIHRVPASSRPASTVTPPRRVTPPATVRTPSPEIPRWLALDEWAVQQRVPPPSRLPGVSTPAWRFPTSGGGLLLLPESRQAQFEGCKYWLGYAPVPTNHTLLVHSTDAAKNISPLLQPFRLPPTGQRVIVIDPGHGGSNTGTRTETGILEKDLTLDWAMRTGVLLARHGWRVYLTRTNDIELSLEDRVIIADKAQASLFLSLHFNSVHPQTQQQGIETFCTTPVGLPSTLVRDGTDEPDRFYPNNAFDSENLRYAVRLHSSLVRKTGAVDRGVRRARFMGVIRSQRRPAILIEAGFLSNPGEARLLATPAYRQQLAEAVVEALVDSTRLAALPVPPRNLP